MIPITPIQGQGPFAQAMSTAASAMRSQATRLRLVAENLANVNSTAAVPGGQPYQRKTMSFEQSLDRVTGAAIVRPGRIGTDQAPFRTVHDPSHPAADDKGYVMMPNVSELIEIADMREAERSYEANLSMMAQARSMLAKTLDILKA
jgi:flagellar basal-body rod protein FlgC